MSTWGPAGRRTLTDEEKAKARQMLKDGYHRSIVAERFRVSPQYIYKHCVAKRADQGAHDSMAGH
jgi:hypothetical protein